MWLTCLPHVIFNSIYSTTEQYWSESDHMWRCWSVELSVYGYKWHKLDYNSSWPRMKHAGTSCESLPGSSPLTGRTWENCKISELRRRLRICTIRVSVESREDVARWVPHAPSSMEVTTTWLWQQPLFCFKSNLQPSKFSSQAGPTAKPAILCNWIKPTLI